MTLSKRAEDRRRNMDKILGALKTCQFHTPYNKVSDYISPYNQREMILLCIQFFL